MFLSCLTASLTSSAHHAFSFFFLLSLLCAKHLPYIIQSVTTFPYVNISALIPSMPYDFPHLGFSVTFTSSFVLMSPCSSYSSSQVSFASMHFSTYSISLTQFFTFIIFSKILSPVLLSGPNAERTGLCGALDTEQCGTMKTDPLSPWGSEARMWEVYVVCVCDALSWLTPFYWWCKPGTYRQIDRSSFNSCFSSFNILSLSSFTSSLQCSILVLFPLILPSTIAFYSLYMISYSHFHQNLHLLSITFLKHMFHPPFTLFS